MVRLGQGHAVLTEHGTSNARHCIRFGSDTGLLVGTSDATDKSVLTRPP